MKDVTIIAPTGFLKAEAPETETGYDVNSSKFTNVWEDEACTKRGSWNIYKNGELVGILEGTYDALKKYIKNNDEK